MKQLKILKQRKKFQKCQYVFKPFFDFFKNAIGLVKRLIKGKDLQSF